MSNGEEPRRQIATFVLGAVAVFVLIVAIVFVFPFIIGVEERTPDDAATQSPAAENKLAIAEPPILTETQQLLAAKRKREADFAALEAEYKEDPAGFEANSGLMATWRELCVALGKPATYKPFETEAEIAARMQRAEQEAAAQSAADLESAKRLLSVADEESLFQGLDILAKLLRSDVPDSTKVAEVFDEQKSLDAQLWLLAEADKLVGLYPDEERYEMLELFWLCHVYDIVGQKDLANERIERAFKTMARVSDADEAIEAGLNIAGYFCFYEDDAKCLRTLKLVDAATPHAKKFYNDYCRAYMPALALLIGEDELAKNWIARAHKSRTSDAWTNQSSTSIARYYDSMIYSLARDFEKARPALDKKHIWYNSNIYALAAAAAGEEAEFIAARRYAKGSKQTGGGSILNKADVLFGDFETGERFAAGYAKQSTLPYTDLALMYSFVGEAEEAKRTYALGRAYRSQATMEAAFYSFRLRIRSGESLATLYVDALSETNESQTVAALTGIVAGLHPDPPQRFKMHIF